MPELAQAQYDVNRVPAAIRMHEVTVRNQQSTARHSQPWTQWKVAYDSAARDNRSRGRRVRRG